MLKIIKSNIEARQASLCEESPQVSLLTDNNIECNGLYLMQPQSYTYTTKPSESIMLSTFQGTGELQLKEGEAHLNVQIMRGDIISIPQNTTYAILNTADECLIISEIIINR